MTHAAIDYVFGDTTSELERLLGQASDLASETSWLLDDIGIRPDWRVADIGCGPIGILDLLSERVRSTGLVIGLEREARFVDMARAEIARRGIKNTTVIHGDAMNPALDKGSFDFVHERLLLINMPEQSRQSVVACMVELARPGGIVATESWDRASLVCYPEHPSWVIMNDAYREAIRATNGDGTSGRTLPSLLRQAGLADIRTKVHVRAAEIGDPRRRHRLNVIESAKSKIVGQGLLTEAQYLAHTRTIADHLADPATLLIDQLFIQAWGRRPS